VALAEGHEANGEDEDEVQDSQDGAQEPLHARHELPAFRTREPAGNLGPPARRHPWWQGAAHPARVIGRCDHPAGMRRRARVDVDDGSQNTPLCGNSERDALHVESGTRRGQSCGHTLGRRKGTGPS
jgi:hypothetical protein